MTDVETLAAIIRMRAEVAARGCDMGLAPRDFGPAYTWWVSVPQPRERSWWRRVFRRRTYQPPIYRQTEFDALRAWCLFVLSRDHADAVLAGAWPTGEQQ